MKKVVLLTLVAGVGVLSAADQAATRRLAKLVSAVGAHENVLQDQSVASSQQSCFKVAVFFATPEVLQKVFSQAIWMNDLKKVQTLLPKIDINEKDKYGDTPFMIACRNDKAEVVKLLLADSRLDVNAKDKYGDTSFILACRNDKAEVVKLLLANNRVDVNEQSEFGYTAFMLACRNGQAEIVKLLLANNRVDVNVKSKFGYTAFMCACQTGQAEIVKLLRADNRVDVNLDGLRNFTGLLSPFIAELKSKDLCIRFLDDRKFLRTDEVERLCTAFADDHELCVKIKEKLIRLEERQERIRWQMLEEERVEDLSDDQKEQLAVPFVQELNWQEEGLVSFAHGCQYQFGIFRDAYARLQRKLAPAEQKYPAYFHAFRFPTQKELPEGVWSKEQAQKQLTLRKKGHADNSLYLFCQASVLHGIRKQQGESPGHYWLHNWSIQQISLTLAKVLQGLIDPIIIEHYQHKLTQVEELYNKKRTSSTKGLLYLFAVTPEFVKNCVGYRHNFTGKDELTSSEQYFERGEYARVEHLIPQLYVTAPEYVNAHIKDMKVYGYDTSTPAWQAYDITLEEVLDLLVHEQKELERIGKEAYYAKFGQNISLQSRL